MNKEPRECRSPSLKLEAEFLRRHNKLDIVIIFLGDTSCFEQNDIKQKS